MQLTAVFGTRVLSFLFRDAAGWSLSMSVTGRKEGRKGGTASFDSASVLIQFPRFKLTGTPGRVTAFFRSNTGDMAVMKILDQVTLANIQRQVFVVTLR